MLLVPTYLDKSSINGMGIFTKDALPAETLVWVFTPGFDLEYEREAFAAFPELLQQYLLHYGNLGDPSGGSAAKQVYLLCGDHARFMNHSDTPNVSAATDHNRALRPIAAGEELTCDYREFDLAFENFT